MDTRLKSAITLAALCVLLVVAAAWGFSAMTEPFPEKADPPICVERTFAAGDRVARTDVTVSVWNAGTRNGLAGLTMELLNDVGFARGQEANAPRNADVRRVEIWTRLPAGHPAVRLVRSHFKPRPRVRQREVDAAGVLVVVGDRFEDLARGQRRVRTEEDASVCGPPSPS